MIVRGKVTLLLLAAICWAGLHPTECVTHAADEVTAGIVPQLPQHLRRPIALIPIDDEAGQDRLLVANQRSGTLSVVDLETRRVVSEHKVATRISDMASHPGAADAFVLDENERSLLAVHLLPEGLEVTSLVEIVEAPSRLVVSAATHQVFITSRWSWTLTAIRFDASYRTITSVERLDLPFPPQELLPVDEGRKLIVADAFGGRLATVDVAQLSIERNWELPGHNIRGLALKNDGSELYIAHQKLNPLARTDFDDVHWGMLITNVVRVLRIDAVLDSVQEPTTGGWLEQLGGVGNAASDPGSVLFDQHGRMMIALSGVDEVAVTRSSYAERFPVGDRPIALATAGNGWLAVANHLGDSISLIDLNAGKFLQTISLGPQPELSAAERGELLFYDARLSHDGWMSCHSCHTDGHSAELLVDTLGDGDYGAPKRIPPLLGTVGTAPWAWTGGMATLDEQVRQSLRSTMQGDALPDESVSQLATYLQSLPSPPPRRAPDQEQVRRGAELFERHGCVRCHRPPSYTSGGVFDVGLMDESGRREFNPPSLRGVGQRRVLFHDGSVSSLNEVLHEVKHQLKSPLDKDDAAALLEFLRSL